MAAEVQVPVGQMLTEKEWQAIRDAVVAAAQAAPLATVTTNPFTNIPPASAPVVLARSTPKEPHDRA